MKLRWKEFEQSLSARVRIHDTRSQMRLWQRIAHFFDASPDVPLWVARGLASLLFPSLIWLGLDSVPDHPRAWMAAASLWGLLVATFAASLLLSSGQADPVYRTLWMLPVTAEAISNYLLRRLARGSVWLFSELFLAYGLVALLTHQHFAYWVGMVICVALQAAAGGALALLFVSWKFLAARITSNLILLIASVEALFALPLLNERLFVWSVYVCNPLGWVNAVFLEGWVGGHAYAWWALLPVLALFATVPFSIKTVRNLNLNGALRMMPASQRRSLLSEREDPVRDMHDQTPNEARMMIGEYLQPLAFNRMGIVERLIASLLPPREQLIGDMLTPSGPLWTKHLLGFLICFALFLVANIPIPIWSLDDFTMAVLHLDHSAALVLAAWGASIILFAMMCVRILRLLFWVWWPEWSVTNSRASAGPSHRTFRLLPVNFWETNKVIAKINTLLFLLLLPPAFIFSFSPACQMLMKDTPHSSTVMPKCLALLWSVSLLLPSLILMPSFNDGWKHWPSFLKTLLAFLVLLTLGGGLLFSPTLLLDGVLTVLFMVLTVGWLAYCGAQYRKGSFGAQSLSALKS